MSFNTRNNIPNRYGTEGQTSLAPVARRYPTAEKEYEEALKPSRLPRKHAGWQPYHETVKDALARYDVRVAAIKGYTNKEIPPR